MMKRLLTLIMMLVASLSAFAWGGKEHRFMAYMAEQHLTQNTRAFLERYLDQSLTEYASWMDRYRDSPGYKPTTKWHMVSVDAQGNFEPDGNGKALPKLNEAIKILSNYKEYDDSTVHINIVYVIHLVPEIHCPAHYYIGEPDKIKRGWQPVIFKGKKVKYHGFWDGSMNTLYPNMTYVQLLGIFDIWSPEKQREVSNGTPDDWCRDNLTRVKAIYDWAKPNDVLPDDFLEQHRELPETQVRLGGYRLARLLNDLFDKAE